ncbi:MAG: UDPglucose 6-dehydrogenase [Hyphomicrobiales bacterium]|jgi:UDPglucose 6-dehydrogenase|nr:UDPglucose 6-dehydrogenase [Hyphomicrobiales bacterium]
MRVTIIGTGYVGLVSGACLSDFGHIVTCVDKDAAKITQLGKGAMPLFEGGLEELVQRNVQAARLFFTNELAPAVRSADIVMIAVGTPSRRGDGFADVSFVMDAAREVARELQPQTIVVTKSTVPVGTGDQVEDEIAKLRGVRDIEVVSNPEFLREGAAIEDFKRPDRIVVGTEDARARAVMRELYRPLFINETPILFTGRRTAELIKYASNAYLATKVTFINEIANLCEAAGANVQDVARGMGLDRRIGSKFLHAGPGFGGSCLPKDVAALAATATQHGVRMQIVESVMAVNTSRRAAMVDRIVAACGGSVQGKALAVLGLTFKPNTDDMREAPSLAILPALTEQGASVRAYDPAGMEEARKFIPGLATAPDPYTCMQDAEALVILTEWDQFRALDLDRVKAALRTPVIVDLRNIYKPADMSAKGFSYVSIGRP